MVCWSDAKISSSVNGWGTVRCGCCYVLSFQLFCIGAHFCYRMIYADGMRGGMPLPAANNRQRVKIVHVCYISSAVTAAFFHLAPFFFAHKKEHTLAHSLAPNLPLIPFYPSFSHFIRFKQNETLKSVNVWILAQLSSMPCHAGNVVRLLFSFLGERKHNFK